jgi:uncharacterized protein YidB (DUF937 family)
VPFVVDDLAAWLVGALADAGVKKLTVLLFGSEQERALRDAATAAAEQSVRDLHLSGDYQETGRMAAAIKKALGKPTLIEPSAGQRTLLETLHASLTARLATLDSAGLGVSGTALADRFISCLVLEIKFRGSQGGPLTPLADQLNHELTQLQGQQIEGKVDRLLDEIGQLRDRPASDVRPAGRPLSEVTDPFALEVHRPMRPDALQATLPLLPPYVPRNFDNELAQLVASAADGKSGIAVLVGGSSTGKTRACWEALQPLRDLQPGWRLWHPIEPSRPEAVLAGLPGVGPRTVVWLNEAQLYLDLPQGAGERVAAGLRELLRDPARAPVLVLATLWPSFWDVLTSHPAAGDDPHANARELLDGQDISVPTAFTLAQMGRLGEAGDARLTQAAAQAEDGHVIQFLAGAPALLARYRNAPPEARALIDAAMDARRLGMRPALPHAFLAAAAPGYLTDTEWDGLGEDWLDQALAYTAAPCQGTRGPLARIRPRPGQAAGPPAYLLADYLDQHGRSARLEQMPPAGFWAAATDHADPGDLEATCDAAYHRGLYRDAAQLRKRATARGDTTAAARLLLTLHTLDPSDQRPARWCLAHARLDDPGAVASLLGALRTAGASDEVAALLARDPAASVSRDNLSGLESLLTELWELGADEQAATVAALADHARARLDSLDDALPWREPAVYDPDPVAHISLSHPGAVANLLSELARTDASEQVAVLLARDPAAHVSLESPAGVASLLSQLQRTGADAQVAALLARDPAANTSLKDPLAVRSLLYAVRQVGATEQLTALADRAAAQVRLDDPFAVATVLSGLQQVGADAQVAALLARDPAAHAHLGHARSVQQLLWRLRELGAGEQVAALLARDPAAHVSVAENGGVHLLLAEFRSAGAADQLTTLANRLPATGRFQLFLREQPHPELFRFGRETDGSPAAPWGWDDLN